VTPGVKRRRNMNALDHLRPADALIEGQDQGQTAGQVVGAGNINSFTP